MRFGSKWVGLLALVAGIGIGGTATAGRAEVIYNTYGPGDSFTLAGPTLISKGTYIEQIDTFYPQNSAAIPFTVPYEAKLSKVTVGTYFYRSPVDVDRMLVSVMKTATVDVGTAISVGEPDPDNVLEQFESAFGPPGTVGVTLTSVDEPLLLPGETYWLAVEAKDAATLGLWNTNDQGLTGITSHDAGSALYGWQNSVPGLLPAAKIEVTPVPEPAGLAVMAAVIGLGLRRRSRAR